MALNKVKHVALEVTMEDGQILGAKMLVPDDDYQLDRFNHASTVDVIAKVTAELWAAVAKAVREHNDEHGNV